MTVYWGHEVPDVAECSVGNRAVTQMPTGMEKEEEMESHLQDAILAQQASTSGLQLNHVIPTPKVNPVEVDRYDATYPSRNKNQRSKYIKVHAWQALERDEPEYDYDTEDETWLAEHTHIEPRVLEKIFDTVESHSSETQIASEDSVINIHNALDSSIVYEVYEYWLAKRTSAATTSGCVGVGGLIPRVRTECRKDAQGAVNPYVAFRRRAEKMQTRKNRKNDEDSYEKILKLVHDMSKAQQLFDMTAKREKQKLALLDMETEILMKRMEMSDFGATSVFNEFAEKMRTVASPTKPFAEINGSSQEEAKKRKRVRRKTVAEKDLISRAYLKKNVETWNRPPALFGQSGSQNVAVSTKPVRDSTVDGRYSFKRRRGCIYRAARQVYATAPPSTASGPATASASVPSTISQSQPSLPQPPQPALVATTSAKPEEPVPAHSRFYETWLPGVDGNVRSIGFARRRVGRGGRVLFDRMPIQRGEDQEKVMDPWAEYCISDESRTFRKRQHSLGTEEESEEQSPKARYFARSDRVNYNDGETEREWNSRYLHDAWKDMEDDEPSEKFEDLEQQQKAVEVPKQTASENDDSEVERMDVDEEQAEEAQITVSKEERAINGNGQDNNKHDDKNEDEDVEDVDVDEASTMVVERIRHSINGGGGKIKPLQEHSPPLSGNGRADRAEPTPVPAKMCGTVSDSDEWREPSGSPSESNSSTEWGGYTQEQVAVSFKAKLMNVDDEEPSPARGGHDHSIKESMSTVTMLERKKFMMPSTIGM
ncbi:unnamed protein product [Caenorhabditis sp. 36 PRJEB53466]|nr:unnamed protein product [Caenorhabditis sp. 36 PRJEB53466]